MIKNIIFDLDNTLYPSSAKINELISTNIINFVANLLNITFEQAHDLRKERLVNYSSTLEWLQKEHNFHDTDFYLHKLHPENEVDALPEYPGIYQLLNSLSVNKVILTNGPLFHAQRVLEFYHIESLFSHIYDITENDLLGKPYSKAYTNILEKEHFLLEETLFVDDNPKYIEGFVKLNGKAVLIDQFESYNNEVFVNSKNKVISVPRIHSVFELPALLSNELQSK